MKIMICGGAGFIGSNFVHYLLEKYDDAEILVFDKLTYAGNLDNHSSIKDDPRYRFVKGDIATNFVHEVMQKFEPQYLVNFAAETHNDKSVHGSALEFSMTNCLGVQMLLEGVKEYNVEKFVNVSTDEVYGSLELGVNDSFREDTPFAPNIPYAAAKAGGDMMCRAYYNTWKVPVVVTHCSNNYGPYQYPEKLIPFLTYRAMNNQSLPIYGDGKNVRDWIWVGDHCTALDLMMTKGVPGEVYNIGVDNEHNNLAIVGMLCDILGKSKDLMTFITDRPGHDRRYSIDSSKIQKELGWTAEYTSSKFQEGLERTVKWYMDNKDWVKQIKKRNGEFNPHIKS